LQRIDRRGDAFSSPPSSDRGIWPLSHSGRLSLPRNLGGMGGGPWRPKSGSRGRWTGGVAPLVHNSMEDREDNNSPPRDGDSAAKETAAESKRGGEPQLGVLKYCNSESQAPTCPSIARKATAGVLVGNPTKCRESNITTAPPPRGDGMHKAFLLRYQKKKKER